MTQTDQLLERWVMYCYERAGHHELEAQEQEAQAKYWRRMAERPTLASLALEDANRVG